MVDVNGYIFYADVGYGISGVLKKCRKTTTTYTEPNPPKKRDPVTVFMNRTVDFVNHFAPSCQN